MRTQALIGLGSNVGDRKAILDGAVAALRCIDGVNLCAVSSYHETSPIGGPAGQGSFLNAAAVLEPTLDPFQLLDALHHVEKQFGRTRTMHWGERTLDLDLLLHGDEIWFTPQLVLPHPRYAFRRFVLAPAAEVAAMMVDPITGRSVTGLLENVDRRPSLLCIDHADQTHTFGATEIIAEVQERLCQRLDGAAIRHPRVEHSYSGLDEDCEQRLLAGIDILSPRRWSRTGSLDQWRIADFSLEHEMRRGLSWLRRVALETQNRSTEPPRFRRIRSAWRKAISGQMETTLIVLIAEPGHDRPPLARYSSPVMIVASNDPGAVTDEIATACEATRG
jgi:2-amino-4-hydroxy-6-hydroxymethyldihydropteridine diphosphokinase